MPNWRSGQNFASRVEVQIVTDLSFMWDFHQVIGCKYVIENCAYLKNCVHNKHFHVDRNILMFLLGNSGQAFKA